MTGASGGADPGARPGWRWDVALSFAGAQRDYVQQVAKVLKARGVRCFYDADEQIDLWGKDLAEELSAIYAEQAATVVVFVSAEYAARDWTRLERRAALNRAVRERREYVLPARFDDTPLPGLLSDIVAIDLRMRTPQQFAAMIADKLARLTISAPAPAADAGDPAWDVEPAYRATLRQLRARTGVLQGRDEELGVIGAFAAGQASVLAPLGSQHAWLVGGPWAGKTALLAEAVHALPPEVDCVAYFLTRPTGDADRERFLAAVVPQLVWLLGTDPPSALDEHVFRQLWEQAAQHAADAGRQLLLIVDGLDEDLRPGGHSVAGWLPGRLPGLSARVLVTSRLHPRLPHDVDPAHPLAALAPDKLYRLPDSPHAARLRELADQEITQLLRRADDDLALDVLGLLTAARGGPLAAADLATLTGSRPWQVRGVLDGEAARTLQQVGLADAPRYTFAHETLLVRCQHHGLGDPGHTRRIEEWAAVWRDRGWPAAPDDEQGTPLYLLDRYPQTLDGDPLRLAALAGDVGWVTAAIRILGVDAVLAELKTAGAAVPGEPRLAAMHAVVRGQAHQLRDREAVGDPGFVPRQLCLQAAELGEALLAADCQTLQLASGNPGLVLQWTTRRASPALIFELGRDADGVRAVAVLPDGRVVTGGGYGDGRVLVWDPTEPGADPVELGRHEDGVGAVAVLPDGRVVTGDSLGGFGGGLMLVWDPAEPGADPVELGCDASGVEGVAVLPDGRVVTSSSLGDFGGGGRVLVWDPAEPGADPVELGCDANGVEGVAVLPDGRVVTGGSSYRRVLAWDPAEPGADPDGRVVTGGYGGGRVLVWDPAEPGADPVELGRHEARVGAVAVLPDGRVVTGGGYGDGRVLVWNPDAAQCGPVELGRHEDAAVSAVAVLPDGRVVTGSDHDGLMLVWDPAEPAAGPVELGLHEDAVVEMAVLPDGRVVTGSYDHGRVLVWEPGAAQRGPVELGRHAAMTAMAVAVLPDGRVVTGGVDDGRVLVWDPADPDADPVELGRDAGGVGGMAVLPDGRVVTASDSYGDRRVLVWDPADPGADPVELGRHEDGVGAATMLPDGRVVTGGGSYGDGRVLVWDPADPGADPVELGRHEDGVGAATMLPDGRVVTGGGSYGDGRVLVWDPADPGANPVELGRHEARVGAVAVLPDGRVVAGDASGRILVWDPADPGTGPVELGRHVGEVRAVAALPDGRVIGGDDDRLWLWDVESNSPGSLLACSTYALATSLSPSEARLVISHARGGISCWEARVATQNTHGAPQYAGQRDATTGMSVPQGPG